MKRAISILLWVLLLCVSLNFCGCSQLTMSGPEKAFNNFEKAYNERDYYRVIEIFKPSEQAKLKLQLELTKGFVDAAGSVIGLDNISDIFFTDGVMSELFGIVMEDSYINIEVISEEYNDSKTRATVTVELSAENETNTDDIQMVKIGDKWYIDEEFDIE